MKFCTRMKQYKRDLLNHLSGSSSSDEDEPLKNIKKEMGSLSAVEGNPMFKAEITVRISTFFWDVVAVAPILPAALPAALQTRLPVYIFGLTDFYSGFVRGNNILSPGLGWQRAGALMVTDSGIAGYTLAQPLGIIPIAALPITLGDLAMFFFDAAAPAFIGVTIIHCNNIAYGTFLNSFVSDLCDCSGFRTNVLPANINQLINPYIFGYQTLFGKLATDSIDPRMYITPKDFQQNIVDIPIKFPVDKNLIIAFSIDVLCQLVDITFFIEKVEPLTLRPK